MYSKEVQFPQRGTGWSGQLRINGLRIIRTSNLCIWVEENLTFGKEAEKLPEAHEYAGEGRCVALGKNNLNPEEQQS